MCTAAATATDTEREREADQWQAERDAAARNMFDAMPGVKSYQVCSHRCKTTSLHTQQLSCVLQGPPRNQEPAPDGLQPDLDDSPDVEEDDYARFSLLSVDKPHLMLQHCTEQCMPVLTSRAMHADRLRPAAYAR